MHGDLLSAARAGDERAFVELTSPSRDELHRHCYRLLGSTTDADDALQETMLRAWQAIGGFEPRAPLRAWLYRIATNVCLRHIERRPRTDYAAAIVVGLRVECGDAPTTRKGLENDRSASW